MTACGLSPSPIHTSFAYSDLEVRHVSTTLFASELSSAEGSGARVPRLWPFAHFPCGHPEATLKPSGSQPVGTRKPPSGYPEATLRLPRGYPATPQPPQRVSKV